MIVNTGSSSLDSRLLSWIAGAPDRDYALLEESGEWTCFLTDPEFSVIYRAVSLQSAEDSIRHALTIAINADQHRPSTLLPGEASLLALQAFSLARGVQCT